ncbi:MAG: malto-oligosyltrehalose trehalohydrolase, partial [Euzebyales bacterium]|nr:malto-oligosyltrehalose trehalohydrolase [Euzebyales bacterium]
DYAFRLNGGPQRPDPASRWQPDGVHGRSRVLDPACLPDTTACGWRAPPLSSAAIYELHVGTFTPEGSLDAAAEHLPELADLGITHVEIMPVNSFNGRFGWGYDGVCWYAVHQPYGGPEAFARFVRACHGHGLAVIVDAVYNHLGPSGNYLPEFGPYLTDRYATPWGEGLNLDGEDSDPVRGFIIGSALGWLDDFGADALRLDAVHGLIDTSAQHLLAELSAAVDALARRSGRPLQLIAESDRCDPLTVSARDVGGAGMDAQWADDLHHAIHTAVTGERDGYYVDYAGLPDVARAYRRGFLYDGRYSVYRRRTVGAPLGDTPGWRLVTCLQNHDQIGNRAFGERLTTLVGPELARIAAVLLCASPTTPMLFMGEEYGETNPFQFFASHPEPELAEAVRRGRREEFADFAAFTGGTVPDPGDPATRTRSTLDRSRADSVDGQAWRGLWRQLLALRRSQPALSNGRRDLVDVLTVDDGMLALLRRDPDGPAVLVVANLWGEQRHLELPDCRWRRLLDTGACGPEGRRALVVTPRSASLWGAAADDAWR